MYCNLLCGFVLLCFSTSVLGARLPSDRRPSHHVTDIEKKIANWREAAGTLRNAGSDLRVMARELGLDESQLDEASLKRALAYIIGGQKVEAMGKYPWQCSLQVWGSHRCGCSLIAPGWAVTAHHCELPLPGQEIAFGSLDLWDGEWQWRKVEKQIKHPQFSWNLTIGMPNDIMLLKLDSPVDLDGQNVATIQVPPKGMDFVGSECHVSGWGATKFPAGASRFLKESPMKVISNEECISKIDALSIRGTQLCTEEENLTAAPCQGDSGGPLACKVGGAWYLAGVVSWGDDCALNLPSVFTRTSEYTDWMCENGALSGDDCT